MTRDELASRIADRLGNRGSAFDTTIVSELQLAQTVLEQSPQLPWFLLTQNTSLVTVANVSYISTPTGYLQDDGEAGQWVIDTTGKYKRLVKQPYDSLRGSTNFDTATLPDFYALQGSKFYFFATPDIAYSLEWNYYTADATLSAGSTSNQWSTYAPDVLIGMAGLEIAKFLRDQNAISYFQDTYGRGMQRMILQDEARRQANLDAAMGG